MASIPAKYIKQKSIDFDGEIFACMGLPFAIAGIEIPPPAIGVFSLLESIDSRVVNDIKNASAMDFCRALYIAHFGKESAADVREWIKQGGKQPHGKLLPFDVKICGFADKYKLGEIELPELYAFRSFLLENSFNGYEMIPDSGGGSFMPCLFGAQTIASIALTCGISDMNKVLWEIPLCLVGHMAAVTAKRNGVKGVEIPKDEADIKLQQKLADERELKGKLHPWQIAEPDNALYGLSEMQKKARPEIKTEFNNILKDFLRAKRLKQDGKT